MTAIIQYRHDIPTLSHPGWPICFVRASWDDPWEIMPYLMPLAAVLNASPSVSEAQFSYHYGYIKREDQTNFDWFAPLDIIGLYIKIVHYRADSQADLWHGVVQHQRFDLFGTTDEPSGTQTLTAYGLEHLLDRSGIFGARTAYDAAPTSYLPPFNLRQTHSPALLGNRTELADGGLYHFGGFEPWSALDVLEYLLHYHTPAGLPLTLSGQYAALSGIHAIWQLEGLSLKQALDKLIDRRRGLGWTIRATDDAINLHIFTTFTDSVETPSGTIPGNGERFSVDWTGSHNYGETLIEQSAANLYDQIVVTGARVKACFTVRSNAELQPGWDTGLIAVYNALTADDTNALDIARGDDLYRPLWSHFILPTNWNWLAGGLPVNVAVAEDGEIDPFTPAPSLPPTPLLRALPVPYEGPDGEVEYQEPAAWVKVPDLSDAWARTDLLGPNAYPGLAIQMLDYRSGIEVRGAVPHVMALDHIDTDALDSTHEPAYRYTDIMATVAIETDTRLTITRTINAVDSPNILTIDVPGAELWRVVPNTVTGIDDAGQPINHEGGITRDDRPLLRTIAALAAAWYGTRRAVVRWTEKRFTNYILPGMLCEAAQSSWQQAAVNTAVTCVQYDFIGMSTIIQTNYGELDFATLLDIPGMSDFRAVGRQFNRLAAKVSALERSLVKLPTRWQGGLGGGGSGGGGIMGRVIAKKSQYLYTVDLYENGLQSSDGIWKDSTQRVDAIVGDIDANEVIPQFMCVYIVKAADGKYYMQPPVWVE